jgi:hypothetical protein
MGPCADAEGPLYSHHFGLPIGDSVIYRSHIAQGACIPGCPSRATKASTQAGRVEVVKPRESRSLRTVEREAKPVLLRARRQGVAGGEGAVSIIDCAGVARRRRVATTVAETVDE